jgi:hypothetical protein
MGRRPRMRSGRTAHVSLRGAHSLRWTRGAQADSLLPPDLAKRLAVFCAEHDADTSDVVSAAVAARLGA